MRLSSSHSLPARDRAALTGIALGLHPEAFDHHPPSEVTNRTDVVNLPRNPARVTRTLKAAALALAVLLAGCGGDSGAPATDGPRVTNPIPVLDTRDGVLEIPTLRAGDRYYESVRLRLSAGGAFSVLSYRDSGPVPSVTARLSKDVDLRTLTRRDSVSLVINRLHIDHKAFDDVAIALVAGRWRYAFDLTEATALSHHDFDINPRMIHDRRHTVVLPATAERNAQNMPVRLESSAYRLCADPHDDGADELSLVNERGIVLALVRAGQPCVSLRVSAGVYTLRHRYGGTGKPRTVFLRHRDTPAALSASAIGPAKARRLSVSGRPLSGADYPEYWAFSVVTDLVAEPAFLAQFTYGTSRSFNGQYPPRVPPNLSADDCLGYFDAAARYGGYRRGSDDESTPRRTLADGLSFFRITYGEDGAPTINGPRYCEGFDVGYWNWSNADAPQANLSFGLPSVFGQSGNWVRSTLKLESLGGNTYLMKYVSGAPRYLASTTMWGPSALPWVFSGGQGYFSAATADSANPQPVRAALRHFPRGLAVGNTVSVRDLEVGQVALFRNDDCTGEALIVDGGPMLAHEVPGMTGSMLLGPMTGAMVYEGTQLQGKSARVIVEGCVKQEFNTTKLTTNPFATAGFGSMSITTASIDLVLQHGCENCNLSNLVLAAGQSLAGANLKGANLNSATLLGVDLSFANLQAARLQGASLDNSNFEGANLCGAFLNKPTFDDPLRGRHAATATGAFFKHANLNGADLSGAALTQASFFSNNLDICQPAVGCQGQDPSTYANAPYCASAVGAKLANTSFNAAFLSGVDFSGAEAAGVNFSGATLYGANFSKAKLPADAGSGNVANFRGALMQGTNFTSAVLTGADFSGAFFDNMPTNDCMESDIIPELTNFPGFKTLQDGSCKPGQINVAICVRSIYKPQGALPVLDSSNVCPDGRSRGPCQGDAMFSPNTSATRSTTKFSLCVKTDTSKPLCTGMTNRPNRCW